MLNKRKWFLITIVTLISLSSTIYIFVKDSENHRNIDFVESQNDLNIPEPEGLSLDSSPLIGTGHQGEQSKYYIVYMEHKGGSASSFIPKTLNPGFKFDADNHVSISYDDNDNIINDGKILVIDNYEISNSIKNQIKEITSEENYEEAIKEIEDRIKEVKSSM